MSKKRNELSAVDARLLDKEIGLDLFIYVYAVAAKNRPEEEDDYEFMARLHDSLISFRKRKADAEAAAVAAFDFDDGASTKGRNIRKGVEKKKSNIKVCHFNKLLSLLTEINRNHSPNPILVPLLSPIRNPKKK